MTVVTQGPSLTIRDGVKVATDAYSFHPTTIVGLDYYFSFAQYFKQRTEYLVFIVLAINPRGNFFKSTWLIPLNYVIRKLCNCYFD